MVSELVPQTNYNKLWSWTLWTCSSSSPTLVAWKIFIKTWIIHYSPRIWRKTHRLRMQFGVHSLSFCIKHTLENALRRHAGSELSEQPGLIMLHTGLCGSSHLFVAHRKDETSTVHVCAVCLFLWFINLLRVLRQRSWGSYSSTVLGRLGVQIFHRRSLYLRKIISRSPYISASTWKISSRGSILGGALLTCMQIFLL